MDLLKRVTFNYSFEGIRYKISNNVWKALTWFALEDFSRICCFYYFRMCHQCKCCYLIYCCCFLEMVYIGYGCGGGDGGGGGWGGGDGDSNDNFHKCWFCLMAYNSIWLRFDWQLESYLYIKSSATNTSDTNIHNRRNPLKMEIFPQLLTHLRVRI